MRVSRFHLAGILLCSILFSSACNIPIDDWPEQTYEPYNPGIVPLSTNAIIGFPWEKVDLRVADAVGAYPGYVNVGDSVALYFAWKGAANVPPLQLDTVRAASWGVSVQSVTDTSGYVIDFRGDTTVAVMERRENGRGMLKPRKAGYVLTPFARVESGHHAATVYACRSTDCVKVKIVSR